MGSKADTPKLSPEERLARKRAAARLRQQRCRARKRQAMLEKKRGEVTRPVPAKATRDVKRQAIVVHTVHHHPQSHFPAYKHVHPKSLCEPWLARKGELPHRPKVHKFPSEPIYNCVSFDSQKSLEEAQNVKGRTLLTPPRSEKTSTVITPTRSPSSLKPLVRVLSDEKLEEPLVPEEEAAVAAMLSLKSGPTTPNKSSNDENNTRPSSPPREVVIAHDSNLSTSLVKESAPQKMPHEEKAPSQRRTVQLHRRMGSRMYDTYAYGPPMKLPSPHSRLPHHPPLAYYRVHTPMPPHPHYHRGYFPPAPRYIGYDYK